MSETFVLYDSGEDGVSSSIANNVFKTQGRTNFALFVSCPEPESAGTSGDTFNATLQESANEDFESDKSQNIVFTKSDTTRQTGITQIAGNAAAAAPELLQKYSLKDENYDAYMKLDITTAGANLAAIKNLKIYMTYDTIKRAAI